MFLAEELGTAIIYSALECHEMVEFISVFETQKWYGAGCMIRPSRGPAKYAEETVDSKLKREEERESEALPLRL